MPVSPFYGKVVLAVVGCSAVGALLPCMYSVVALRQEALCYWLQEALARTGNVLVEQRTPPPTSKQECGGHLCLF